MKKKKAFEIRFRCGDLVFALVLADTKEQARYMFEYPSPVVAMRAQWADGLAYDERGRVVMEDADNQKAMQANGWFIYTVREKDKPVRVGGWREL